MNNFPSHLVHSTNKLTRKKIRSFCQESHERASQNRAIKASIWA